MQTTRASQRWLYSAAIVAALCMFLALILVAPTQASAKSYTMPKVDIQATIQPDGSLHVVEKRTFDFSGSFSAVWWTQGELPPYASYSVNGVKMSVPESYTVYWDSLLEDGPPLEFTEVNEVPFQTDWRVAGGPGTTAYSVDEAETTCYLFFDLANTYMVAEIDYEIKNAVTIYDDVAELYWKFLAEEWAVDSDDVTCTIHFPVPEGETPVPAETVYAWGHGSLDASLKFSEDAHEVTYMVPTVPSGEWAEARVIFPRAWITSPDEQVVQAYAGTQGLQNALDDEQRWADEANRERNRGRLIGIGLLVLLFLVFIGPLIWAGVKVLRHGLELKPTTTYDYWRDVPDKGVHPAVIARLENWDKKDSDQLGATIMHLANQGAFQINKGSYEAPTALGGTKLVDDYYLTRNTTFVPETELDEEALSLLFSKASGGKKQVWLGAVKKYAKDHPASCKTIMNRWHNELGRMVATQGYFDLNGENAQDVIHGVALAYGAIALGGLSIGLWPTLFLLIPIPALLLIAHFAPRRTQHGADVHERCKALRRWLTDFSAINERPPTDVKVWGEFMVYAYIFGVADKALREMRKVVPEVFAQEEARMVADSSYVPFYATYGDTRLVGGSSFADALSSSVHSVATASVPSSDGSGGGGFSGGGGGGFSGGGGGGFGGGGGGGAR